ncbi:MAG TPA: hypothetical protein VK445_12310 [Dissulfurispiraceae bacterium]|nr:hypothetical protein [Dissulfurispiraceae bacterium]
MLGLTRGGSVVFSCVQTCAEICCTGATMLTIDEFAKLFRFFAVTAGFRAYTPANAEHRDFLDTVGERIGEKYVIGDFIAGNWRRKRCSMLAADRTCRLHESGFKPMQCQIVPLCAVFPESVQPDVLAQQQAGAFRGCWGFQDGTRTGAILWDAGRIVNEDIREPFYRYREGMVRQRIYLQTILNALKGEDAYHRMLAGKTMLEAAWPADLLLGLLHQAGFSPEQTRTYITVQSEMCRQELDATPEATVFQDSLLELQAAQRCIGSL